MWQPQKKCKHVAFSEGDTGSQHIFLESEIVPKLKWSNKRNADAEPSLYGDFLIAVWAEMKNVGERPARSASLTSSQRQF